MKWKKVGKSTMKIQVSQNSNIYEENEKMRCNEEKPDYSLSGANE
jgi:hypothetical protein